MMQRRRWFAGYLQTQFWNCDLAGNARFGRLGTMMMTIKAFDTLQPIYGLTAGLLLIVFLLLGKTGIAIAAFELIAAKIAVDLTINSWMVYVYRRVTGDRVSSRFADIIIANITGAVFIPVVEASRRSVGLDILPDTTSTLGHAEPDHARRQRQAPGSFSSPSR